MHSAVLLSCIYILKFSLLIFSSFFFYSSGAHRDLHSFPTRRSSDLRLRRPVAVQRDGHDRRGQLVRPQRSCPSDRKSTRLNSSHLGISYAVFCLKKKKKKNKQFANNKQQQNDKRVHGSDTSIMMR